MFGILLRATWLVTPPRPPLQLEPPRQPDIQPRPPTAQKRINSLPWGAQRVAMIPYYHPALRTTIPFIVVLREALQQLRLC